MFVASKFLELTYFLIFAKWRGGEWGGLMIFGALMAQRWLGLAISTSGTRRKYFPVGLDAASLPHTVPKAAPQTLTGCLLPVSFDISLIFCFFHNGAAESGV